MLIITRSGPLTGNRQSVCIWKSQRSLCVLFSRRDSWFMYIPFCSMIKFKFLAHLPVDHLSHPFTSCTPFELVCPIRLICDWAFCPLDRQQTNKLYVVHAVSGHCNYSFFALSFLVSESLYRCINAILNAGEFSSSFFSWLIVYLCHLSDVRPYA